MASKTSIHEFHTWQHLFWFSR